jgi:hypothetical protein
MCRTVATKNSSEKSACVGCKMSCIDIDSEKAYWSELQKPGRRLVQYGYLGMVIAFYFYYFLYSGNWDYYFSGAWTHEEALLTTLFDPGFYINHQIIPIPKSIAVFITYAVFTLVTFCLGLILEKLYRRYRAWRGRPISAEQAQHVIFSIFTTASFWTFFSYGARPSLNRLPTYPLLGFNSLVVIVGAVWLYRTLNRQQFQYDRENMATSLRKQLQKLELDPELLEGRVLEDLSPDEIYTLAKALSGFSQQMRLQTYRGTVQDLLEQRMIDIPRSFDFFKRLRQELQLQDADHFATIEAIAVTHPEVLVSRRVWQSPAQSNDAAFRTIAKRLRKNREQ